MPRKGTADREAQLAEIEKWLVDRSAAMQCGEPRTAIDPDLDLVESGLVDSLRLVEFIFVLNRATGARINVHKISLGQFRTLRSIRQDFLTDAA